MGKTNTLFVRCFNINLCLVLSYQFLNCIQNDITSLLDGGIGKTQIYTTHFWQSLKLVLTSLVFCWDFVWSWFAFLLHREVKKHLFFSFQRLFTLCFHLVVKKDFHTRSKGNTIFLFLCVCLSVCLYTCDDSRPRCEQVKPK